ncbi:DUF2252 family protein [Undibacterium sp. TJN25]|uniref:DUF2252 family protein n=1 Tax=Undibacterium sp. TJN25 TaxID=3413056 RepID=UPI003BF21545
MKKKQKLIQQLPQAATRSPTLVERRNLKMATSAHAYVRGSTSKFYEWLDTASGKIPEGPAIWICGDCHIGNLGPVADIDGKVDFQIRDFDQTVIGNPAHDLIRLALSLAFAARGSNLPGIMTATMLQVLMDGYASQFVPGDETDVEVPSVVRASMKVARRRTWKQLARERIEDTNPNIPMGKRFWPILVKEHKAIQSIFTKDNAINLVNKIRCRKSDDKVALLDAAYWVKGCSSLGLLRYAVLLDVDVPETRKQEICLMDVKEAVAAKAPRYTDSGMPTINAERVVEGARQLSPHLGNRMLASRVLGKSVFVRELRPEDMKLDIDELTQPEALKVARYFGAVVGKAHSRQMDHATALSWFRELNRNLSSKGAPNWLWKSTVELAALHEAGYLEHCRRYVEMKIIA